MSPLTHLFISWSAANAADINKRERAFVTVAGIIPDADGFGIVANLLTRNTTEPLDWWETFHHVLGHNLLFGLLFSLAAFCCATKRWIAALLCLLMFHVHLLCDLVGARGPDGDQWPIPYLVPFSDLPRLAWSGQWALNAWPNFLITGAAIAFTFYFAWKRGFSLLEMISARADQAFIAVLRKCFGNPS